MAQHICVTCDVKCKGRTRKLVPLSAIALISTLYGTVTKRANVSPVPPYTKSDTFLVLRIEGCMLWSIGFVQLPTRSVFQCHVSASPHPMPKLNIACAFVPVLKQWVFKLSVRLCCFALGIASELSSTWSKNSIYKYGKSWAQTGTPFRLLMHLATSMYDWLDTRV